MFPKRDLPIIFYQCVKSFFFFQNFFYKKHLPQADLDFSTTSFKEVIKNFVTAFTVFDFNESLQAERDNVFTINDVIDVVTSDTGFSSIRFSVSSFSRLASNEE